MAKRSQFLYVETKTESEVISINEIIADIKNINDFFMASKWSKVNTISRRLSRKLKPHPEPLPLS
jgi:hypothetical protein